MTDSESLSRGSREFIKESIESINKDDDKSTGRIKVLNICMECAKKCKFKIKNELKRIEKRLELPKIAKCGIQITDNIIMYETLIFFLIKIDCAAPFDKSDCNGATNSGDASYFSKSVKIGRLSPLTSILTTTFV